MTELKFLNRAHTETGLPFEALVEALRAQFQSDVQVPLRHQHRIDNDDEPQATLLLMPVWDGGGFGGVKLVNVHPGNGARGLPAISASYLLFDCKTGQHIAVLDGGELTARRTAAASALAVDYLSRKDATSLLLVGAGRVAANLAPAYRAVRPIDKVVIWNRSTDRANRLCQALARDGIPATVATELESAVRGADIISCATISSEPLVLGDWLRPGQHLDLIGGFTPQMREADDEAVRRSKVFIDTDAAFSEAGDITQPIEAGILSRDDVEGDLFALCRGTHPGRTNDSDITLFKAVGTALEDLAAAALAYNEHLKQRAGA